MIGLTELLICVGIVIYWVYNLLSIFIGKDNCYNYHLFRYKIKRFSNNEEELYYIYRKLKFALFYIQMDYSGFQSLANAITTMKRDMKQDNALKYKKKWVSKNEIRMEEL